MATKRKRTDSSGRGKGSKLPEQTVRGRKIARTRERTEELLRCDALGLPDPDWAVKYEAQSARIEAAVEELGKLSADDAVAAIRHYLSDTLRVPREVRRKLGLAPGWEEKQAQAWELCEYFLAIWRRGTSDPAEQLDTASWLVFRLAEIDPVFTEGSFFEHSRTIRELARKARANAAPETFLLAVCDELKIQGKWSEATSEGVKAAADKMLK